MRSHGDLMKVGVEGTGSLRGRAGTGYLAAHGVEVADATRPTPSSLSSVARPAAANRIHELDSNVPLRTQRVATSRPAGDAHATLEPRADQAPRVSLWLR